MENPRKNVKGIKKRKFYKITKWQVIPAQILFISYLTAIMQTQILRNRNSFIISTLSHNITILQYASAGNQR